MKIAPLALALCLFPALADAAAEKIECTFSSCKSTAPFRDTSKTDRCDHYSKFTIEAKKRLGNDTVSASVTYYFKDGTEALTQPGRLWRPQSTGMHFATETGELKIFLPYDGSAATAYLNGNTFMIDFSLLSLNCRAVPSR